MQPHEIKPDTQLVTIIGVNAQTGLRRRYFNKILKYYAINATAIALNIKEEQFDFVMLNVTKSKVTRVIIEPEFAQAVKKYLSNKDNTSNTDFIEVKESDILGFCLEDEIKLLFDNPNFMDENTLEVAKMMKIASRWFDTPFDLDLIPIIL
jgi:hypothetical protein